jgi:uncharacterized protein (DUF486 family)
MTDESLPGFSGKTRGFNLTGANGDTLSNGRFWLIVLTYFLITAAIIFFGNLFTAADYVGIDNDDTMRLVEVRDLLAGQGWFDLMQYRLGLTGGTLMHWSRVIDAPIAALISFFSLFLSPEGAERVALAIWPLSLLFPLFAAAALSGRRMGGEATMHISLLMAALLAFGSSRFYPGAIDHHNVQLVLTMVIVAMLLDPQHRASNYAVAGACAAFAIAIGAETTPLIAATALAVALSWAIIGEAFRAAAKAFGLSLTLTISALFFLTVPSSSYSLVTCDSLSLGFYGLSAIGGTLLFLSASAASALSRAKRFALLAANGIAILSTASVLAPQCMQSPLANLDPLLVKLWLNHVGEARSVIEQMRTEPEGLGAFYAPGLLAMGLCLYRIIKAQKAGPHAVLFLLILICWGISLIQLRVAVFANLIAIPVLALAIANLRAVATQKSSSSASLGYLMVFAISTPLIWALVAAWSVTGWNMITGRTVAAVGGKLACTAKEDITQLAKLPTTVVAAPVDSGAPILRFTDHRVLSAPYHRNQGGMLAEIHIGLSSPVEAEAFLRGEDVGILAFCPSDISTTNLIEAAPDGLYASLKRGVVPDYLEALPKDETSSLQLYRVRP